MIVTDQPLPKNAPEVKRYKATLAIHGGAGGTLPPYIPPSMEAAYRAALRRSLVKGYRVLSKGGSALEAVCTSVQEMEDDPLFNAAKGAVFTRAGTNECEASVMTVYPPRPNKNDSQAELQRARRCASAILVRNTRNPILLAKALLQNARENPHVILSGKQAEEMGWQLGCEKVDDSYYYTRRRWLEHRKSLGLPMDDDPGRCDRDIVEGEETVIDGQFDPPPSYYANSETDATPSLDDSSSDEKATDRSTTDEAATPSRQSSEDNDVGLQQFTHWYLDFDSRRHHGELATEDGDQMERRSSGSWQSSSFDEIPIPSSGSDMYLHRHQVSISMDSLPTEALPAGTVGAVALDENGHLAVATSTGGITNKLPGRIGDTPTPGAGFWSEYWRIDSAPAPRKKMTLPSPIETVEKENKRPLDGTNRSCPPPCEWIRWIFGSRAQAQEQQDEEDAIEQANNKTPVKASKKLASTTMSISKDFRGVAVSGTGTGDYFLRSSFASLLVHRMRFLGEGVDVAGRKAVAELGEIGGVGGAICIDEGGRVSFPMNSATMNRGFITEDIGPKVAIYSNEECV